MKEIGVLLLAAGSSSRMGSSKQLLEIHGVPAIRYMVDRLKSDKYDLYVVTGAYRQKINGELEKTSYSEIYNPRWVEGMGTSISAGVKEIQNHPYKAVIIIAADQLLVTEHHLSHIIEIWQRHPRCIISAFYDTVKGIPALFPRYSFPQLIQLKGDAGARKIIRQNIDEIIFYNLPEAQIDIDTLEDYQGFIKANSHENN